MDGNDPDSPHICLSLDRTILIPSSYVRVHGVYRLYNRNGNHVRKEFTHTFLSNGTLGSRSLCHVLPLMIPWTHITDGDQGFTRMNCVTIQAMIWVDAPVLVVGSIVDPNKSPAPGA